MKRVKLKKIVNVLFRNSFVRDISRASVDTSGFSATAPFGSMAHPYLLHSEITASVGRASLAPSSRVCMVLYTNDIVRVSVIRVSSITAAIRCECSAGQGKSKSILRASGTLLFHKCLSISQSAPKIASPVNVVGKRWNKWRTASYCASKIYKHI